MAVDFERLMSQEAKARLKEIKERINDIFSLSDTELGECLLKLSRQVRDDLPERFGKPELSAGYNAYLVWDLIPELAYRLGCRSFHDGERADWQIRNVTSEQLRNFASTVLFHTSSLSTSVGYTKAAALGSSPCPWDIIKYSIPNGNPVAIALDRVAPPDSDSLDEIAKHIREISSVRGMPAQSAWSPLMQNYGNHVSSEIDDPAGGGNISTRGDNPP
jgi:hypothetical protein